jgi:hypothetical protein
VRQLACHEAASQLECWVHGLLGLLLVGLLVAVGGPSSVRSCVQFVASSNAAPATWYFPQACTAAFCGLARCGCWACVARSFRRRPGQRSLAWRCSTWATQTLW